MGVERSSHKQKFIGGVIKIMEEKSKEIRISDELARISRSFANVDDNKRSIVAPLLQNAAFMKVTLEDLQKTINEEGATDSYKNGANQFGVKQSATLQAYNSLVKNFTTIMKTLAQLVPESEEEDGLDKFNRWFDEIIDEEPAQRSGQKSKV